MSAVSLSALTSSLISGQKLRNVFGDSLLLILKAEDYAQLLDVLNDKCLLFDVDDVELQLNLFELRQQIDILYFLYEIALQRENLQILQ